MYQVVIVEDNPMVSMLNRTFTEKDPRFKVLREFPNGREALGYLQTHPADLAILDMFMPGLSGLELLRELRAREISLDVIMITAAHDTATLNALLKLGVADYLVKPFTYSRFQQALERFCQGQEAMGQDSVSQSDIDRLLFSPPPTAEGAPKGMQEKTLDRLRQLLTEAGSSGATSEALSLLAGLSAVTVRRYLNYMVEQGDAEGRMNYDTGGRPCTVYRRRLTGTGTVPHHL